MVIRDDSPPTLPSPLRVENSPAATLATAWERLGAFIIDSLSVVMPLALIAIAPLKRQWLIDLYATDGGLSTTFIVGMIVCIVAVVIGYQTLMLRFFSATLGKMFFGLIVVDVWTEKPLSWSQCFLRSWVWLLSTLLCFVPHVAIFHNRRRRPIHDRVADSIVLSRANRTEGRPNFVEVSFGQSVVAMVWAVMAVLTSFTIHQLYKEITDPAEIAKTQEEDGVLCKVVGQALKEWKADTKDSSQDRLEVAMAMYAAGAIEDECLDGEAQFVFDTQGPTPVAYLAKSFVKADDEALSDLYLAEVCKVESSSVACHFSQLLQLWSNGQKEAFLAGLESLAGTQSAYVQIWTIRHFISHDLFADADRYLQTLKPHPSMAGFLGMARARTLWGRQQSESAVAVTKTLYENLASSDKRELSGWMCMSELNRSCQFQQSEDCVELERLLDAEDTWKETRQSLALVMLRECQGTTLGRGEREKIADARVLRFAALLDKKRSGAEHEAIAGLRDLLREPEVPNEIRAAALDHWLSWDNSGNAIVKMMAAWEDLSQGLPWFEIGRKLMVRAYQEGEHARVVVMGERLNSYSTMDGEFKVILAKSKDLASHLDRIPASARGLKQ